MPVPRLAITQRVVEETAYPERRDALSQEWPALFARLSPEAVLLPVPNRPESAAGWMEAAGPDALILTGGNDWGEAQERDDTERRLVEAARRAGLPILGVCRGMQVLNVLFGGSLAGNVAAVTGSDHVAVRHSVRLTAPAFERLAGTGKLKVNSFHRQGVTPDRLSKTLSAFAESPDGVVEGLFHPSEAVLGLQWHPERPGSSETFDADLIRRILRGDVFWK